MKTPTKLPGESPRLSSAECLVRLALAGVLGFATGVLVALAWLRAN